MKQAQPRLDESNKNCQTLKILGKIYDKSFVRELYTKFFLQAFLESPEHNRTIDLLSFNCHLKVLLEKTYVGRFGKELKKLGEEGDFSVLEGPFDCLVFECMKAIRSRKVLQLGDWVVCLPISLLE
jgi:hypothetical protein